VVGASGIRIGRAVALATAVALWPLVAAAQGRTLTGTVTDETGEPVSGAIVTATCGGQTRVANSDNTGRFTLLVPSSRCDVVASRFGFRASSMYVDVGPFMRTPVIVLQRTAADFAIGGSGLRVTGAPSMTTDFGSGWRVTSDWKSGRPADEVRSRSLQRVAGGERWQTESKTSYTSASGFRADAGVVVRHGYGAPLFMMRPFADDRVLPELFPAPDPSGINWSAVFTATTPSTHYHGIDLSGSFQAYMRLGPPPAGAPALDRGLRASLHFKFK
jgi:hypothetical protein